ncbi:hypothetical protein ABZ234_27130 [Nocardiopsis sp. NPDC006198]|uniref:hypothetical protein n=1 Tax=Nocardiopsis sp. NPDC006198 TaxID=3154472 RepID=UPI0033A4D9C4
MIPQGDPHPSVPRPPRPRWAARLRTYRASHPGAFALRASGALLFVIAAAGILGFSTATGAWLFGALLTMGLLLVTGTLAMAAVLSGGMSPEAKRAGRALEAAKLKNLPPGTDPAKLAEAWRLVRKGRLGPDPETNRLGRIVVEGQLSSGTPVALAVVFATMALLNVFQVVIRILESGVSGFPILLLGLSALLLVLACMTPSMMKRRRLRVEAFRDAYDAAHGDGADEGSDTTA